MTKRIVVKLGTNILTKNSTNLDMKTIDQITDQISTLNKLGNEILIVTSGAVRAGKQIMISKKSNVDLDNKKISFRQGLAAIGQPELMTAYKKSFNRHNIIISQILLTRDDLNIRKRYSFS